jgi:predicted AlkP superfamily pyrophosphatase or phosphodiesterase
MKKGFLTAVLFSCIAATQAQHTKKALFVIVDGSAADVIEQQPTPNLDKIAKVGGYTRAHVGGEKGAYSQTPTISAVGYNSLLTGTWVNKHNVWDNDIAAPNYNYRTLFRFFKEQYPQKKTAVFSSWLDNRTKLVGEGLPATGNLKVDHHFDGLELDTVQFPHDKKRDFMHRIDEAVVDKAAACIREEAPDLSWVYLEYTDDMGHMHGDSPEFYKAIAYMDQQMGRLWEAINYREKTFKEDWVIYITTDHGRDSATGKHHGGQSNRERSTWIVTNAKKLNN